jgi:predicted dehydrogenase
VKVAVLSFAHVRAKAYVTLLRDWDGIELVTADPDAPSGDPDRGRTLADRLDVAYSDSWDEVFSHGPEAVVIAGDSARHRELVERAASAGAYVLCETPLATREADAEAMISTCERAGVGLMVAHPVRFSPAFAGLRRAVAGGSLGGLLSVHGVNNGSLPAHARRHCLDPELTGGGALAENAAHITDLVDTLLNGEQAADVYAQANSNLDGDSRVETAGLISVRYPSGVVASVDCSYRHPAADPARGGLTLRCAGEKAMVEFDPFPRMLAGFDAGTLRDRWEADSADLDSAMLDEFLEAARTGRRPSPDGEAGLRTLRLVLAARHSLSTGQPVVL